MKLLVFSDSHASLRLMRNAIGVIQPNWVAHLGDFYEDAQAMAEEFPEIPFYMVPGNCDQHRAGGLQPGVLCPILGGVHFYMTHGHNHRVKLTRSLVIADGQSAGAQVILYGHTHVPDCHMEENIWVVNPGSCGHAGGSAAIIEAKDGCVEDCRIVSLSDLEEMK